MKILVTGSSGLLGTEIMKLDLSLVGASLPELDVTNFASVKKIIQRHRPDVVLHLAAATNPPMHEKDPVLGIETNIIGTAHVALACAEFGAKVVYTSSDYVYHGQGPHEEDESVLPASKFYWSKFGGECAVRMLGEYLILRLSFGPRPFPYDQVYADQWTSKLYVDEMAPLVLAAAKSGAIGILNLGGPRTTLEDYAKRTKPDIATIPRPAWVPKDTSLDLTKMKRVLDITDEKDLYT